MIVDAIIDELMKVLVSVLQEGSHSRTVKGTREDGPLTVKYNVSLKVGLDRAITAGRTRPAGQTTPMVDVIEKGDRKTVLALLPGVAKEDVRVDVVGGDLSLDVAMRDGPHHWMVPCGKGGEVESARFANGVLEVVVKERGTG